MYNSCSGQYLSVLCTDHLRPQVVILARLHAIMTSFIQDTLAAVLDTFATKPGQTSRLYMTLYV